MLHGDPRSGRIEGGAGRTADREADPTLMEGRSYPYGRAASVRSHVARMVRWSLAIAQSCGTRTLAAPVYPVEMTGRRTMK